MYSPDEYGVLSTAVFTEEDCEMLRTKHLTLVFYAQNMGEGGVVSSNNVTNPEWDYNPPGSIGRDATRLICHMADGLEISQAEFKNRVSSWKEFVLNN